MRQLDDAKEASAATRVACLVARVGIALTRGETLAAMLDQCAAAIVEHMDVALARIWTIPRGGDTLVLRASSGPVCAEGRHLAVRLGETKIGRIAAERRPHLTNKFIDDPMLGDPEWARREGVVSFAGYPLLVDDELVGVMAMYARHELPYSVMEILRSVADVVSVGIRRKQADDDAAAHHDQLVQAQKLEAIGRLAGGIAHDFNNLMTVVIGNIACLKDSLEPGSDAALQADEVQTAAERAATLTQQLLAFGRKQMLQPKVLSVNDVVLRLQSMLQRLLGERIVLKVSLHSALGAVHVDEPRLEQVIVNLAVNARDAMPDGGTLTIATDHAEVGGDGVAVGPAPGGYVTLSVTDDGCGMDDRTRARIFEPFFTTKPFGQGSGLGLSTVEGIVSQSGGFIEVQSEMGRGSCFRVYLPRYTHALPGGHAEPAIPRGSETVLVVEDEERVLRLAHGILSRLGYHVLEAATTERAMRICKQTAGPIHLLVTDVVMPSMNGPELYRSLTQIKPAMRVLYVSGYADDLIRGDRILPAGVDVLPKPFTPSTLGRRVRHVLDESLPLENAG